MTDRLDQLRQIVALDPDDATSQFLLGRELATQEQWDEACTALERAIEIQPDYSAAYRQLGNCLEKLERTSDAVAVYERGVAVAEEAGDLQAGKEMRAFLRRISRESGASEG